MESTRLKKVERLVQKELSLYFQALSAHYSGRLISVTVVHISPDLSIAKVFLSIFPTDKDNAIYDMIVSETNKIKYHIGNKMRNQLRKIPDLQFLIDDSLDHSDRINELLSGN